MLIGSTKTCEGMRSNLRVQRNDNLAGRVFEPGLQCALVSRPYKKMEKVKQLLQGHVGTCHQDSTEE